MTTYAHTLATDFGNFSLAVTPSGALVATAFGDIEHLQSHLPTNTLLCDEEKTRPAAQQIKEFLDGKRRDFSLSVAPQGSPFQLRVWTILRAIPFGQTRSYGDIARQLKSSARAVGRANATNPVCVVIPCHRVIAADGSLSGFAYGQEVKRRLLALEGALLPL